MSDFRVVPFGDSCLSVVFNERVDQAVNACCVGVAEAIERKVWDGVRDVVPADHTIAVYFDPLTVERPVLVRRLEQIAAAQTTSPAEAAASLEIPVRYSEDAGPDLASVAAFAGCSEEEVVRIHTATVYRVYMLGFLPGFAYLGSVDRRIAMPRLDAPRLKGSAGSVGIAGRQTGIYPCDTPKGWRVIGRTAVKPFDVARPEPFLFKPGRNVKFVAA